MSAGLESSTDILAVACVVEASLLVASEWTRIRTEYVFPLLKRLAELHPSHQFWLGFVTYGAADTRPHPLISKRYFAPFPVVVRELRDEPSKLGIGQTNSGGGRGLSALEGLVAAIELFDILMTSTNSSPQSPQKENRSLISHLLHVAASPPDVAQRPQWNSLQHLDFVSWDSIPTELRKRKINLSLISLKRIPQFQDLYSAAAGSGVQSPWFNVHAPHILSLAGFPVPQKGIKRQTDTALSDHSPDAKRPKVVADTISKTLSASPSIASARAPPNQRAQQSGSSQVAPLLPTSLPAQNASLARSLHATPAPVSTPASTSVSGPPSTSGPSLPDTNPELLEQVATTEGTKFRQMLGHLRTLEGIILAMDSQVANLQNAGQSEKLAGLLEERARRITQRDQIRAVLKQHYLKIAPAKGSLSVPPGPTGSAPPDGLIEAGPSIQSHPPNAPLNERSMGTLMGEHKSVATDSQNVAFWQTASNITNPLAGPSQIQPHSTVPPEIAARVQQMIEQKALRSQVSGAASQTSATISHGGVRPGWSGTLSWTSPGVGGQVAVIHVIAKFSPTSDIRPDQLPNNLTLKSCKQPVKDDAELSSWVRRHQPRAQIVQFALNPRAPDGSINEQKFLAIHKFMTDHRIYAYAGWPLPSGKFSHNMYIFPMGPGFVGAVFFDGIPDLPGGENILDAQPPVEEAKPQLPRGFNIPPAILARIQSAEPAKRKQMFAQLREHMLRQQLQQSQQPHYAPGQAVNSLGMAIPPNMYGAVANIPSGLHTNVNVPTNAGAYNAGGGTVNYEMMQSFMQRSAEGSTSQGMDTG